MSLPEFRYHPDPISTGSIKASEATCVCCDQARGYIYAANTYCEEDLEEALCPWCIADGSAAAKFDATFSDDNSLLEADISVEIVEEVTRRTPGFTSWQQELWQTCCDDACEFHGDATKANLKALKGKSLEEILEQMDCDKEEWTEFLKIYEPGSSPAVYHFVCRHCKKPKYAVDFD
jgi:uncharacterized protein CbrC (UPF0167 family)